MAAGLAAELEKNVEGAQVTIERGPKQSELAVLVDGEQIFSRLEQMRYPEPRELIAACRARS
ncbi:Rdx family protein [Trichlorobacter sp.]|uniref:Rdx family protein n=1 Tax=Trichlorobacter sp. TaxID=2911007 RepID=UPI0039B8B0C6